MDNKKFEQLIEFIINEDEDKARALFHDIVVEKSREIYENIIAEEMEEEGMHGQVGDLMDEISAEESGVIEGDGEEEEFDIGDDDGDEVVDFDSDEVSDVGGEDVEDRVDALEDKLDQLMAEFEELMGDEEGEDLDGDGDFDEPGEQDFGGEEGGEDFGGEEDMMESDDEEEETLEEAVQLKKVSVTHGDNGQNTKSIALHDPKIKAAGVNPVKFSGASEAVPTSPKGPSNAYSKGETQVKGAGSFKNAPGKDNFSEKGEAAPKPKHGDNGSNNKSVIESRKTAKKRI